MDYYPQQETGGDVYYEFMIENWSGESEFYYAFSNNFSSPINLEINSGECFFWFYIESYDENGDYLEVPTSLLTIQDTYSGNTFYYDVAENYVEDFIFV